MKINKSSRHSKITGNFGEGLVLYWLSKHGFECANVDHTGIDIIARNPETSEIMGISVKSRSRYEGTGNVSVSIEKSNFEKVQKACDAFGCKPYFAIVVDKEDKIVMFILSMNELLKLRSVGKTNYEWGMNKQAIDTYQKNPNIKIVEFAYKSCRW